MVYQNSSVCKTAAVSWPVLGWSRPGFETWSDLYFFYHFHQRTIWSKLTRSLSKIYRGNSFCKNCHSPPTHISQNYDIINGFPLTPSNHRIRLGCHWIICRWKVVEWYFYTLYDISWFPNLLLRIPYTNLFEFTKPYYRETWPKIFIDRQKYNFLHAFIF